MSTIQWVQTNTTYNRDVILQWFHNISTNNRVYGRTSGTMSSNIHLYYQDGTDSGFNLDPSSGEISKDGNVLGDILAIAVITVAGAAGGALGIGGAAADSAKDLFSSSSPKVPTGLVFPPA